MGAARRGQLAWEWELAIIAATFIRRTFAR
jgi:hypothetical protein